MCHGADGRGTVMRAHLPRIPNFTLADWQNSRNLTQIMVTILEGKGETMPQFRGKVSEEQARDLAALVILFGPAKEAPELHRCDDFMERFRALEVQREELKRRYEELSSPKPD